MEYYFKKALLTAELNDIAEPDIKIMKKYWPNSSLEAQRANFKNMITEKSITTLAFTIVCMDICKCSFNLIRYGKEKKEMV